MSTCSVEKVKVAVRVRPFNRRELELKNPSVVEIQDNCTILRHPNPGDGDPKKSAKTFSFDHCFDSMSEGCGHGQVEVYEALGGDILENAFKGYNTSIFAYGQTGSGKSYSMMGTQDDPGLIPRLCVNLFKRIEATNDDTNETKAEVSYMEIYNEKVHDLLDPLSGKRGGLKVREHSVLGPYVDGLSQLVVSSFQDIQTLMEEGNKSRTVAATNMNNESSRSHAVFTIILTSRMTDKATGVSGERVARLSLVDLAGSERAVKTGAVGQRLKEGSNINKSLTTLGLVISKLADKGSSSSKDKFIPYRDSALTWLLKDSLGGNARTIMIATLSPAADNYQETLSTLRYADRAKRIVNHAVVNEDPNAKIIRELRSEIEALKEMLIHAADPRLLKEKLGENEKIMKEVSLTWQEKVCKTEQIQEDRRHAMEKMGISIQSSGIKVEKDRYFLVNLNADPSLNELLVYYLTQDSTLIGREDAATEQNIKLSGLGIQAEHSKIFIESNKLYLEPLQGAKTCVNGREIQDRIRLYDGDRILWGFNHFFRVNCPKSAADDQTEDDGKPADQGTKENSPSVDWRMAQEEVLMMESFSQREIKMRMEERFNTEKQNALENQKRDYERQLETLRQALANHQDNDYDLGYPLHSSSYLEEDENEVNPREDWTQGLSKLKEDIVLANVLIREANLLAEELGKSTRFSSTLRIPPHNLTPNRYSSTFLAEPAILVKQGETGQQATWSLDKMDSKIIQMRDMYKMKGSRKLSQEEIHEAQINEECAEDPFYEMTQNHELIGVANLYLDALFYNVNFTYWIPLVSPQGEVSGRLKIELEKIRGNLPEDRIGGGEDSSECSEESSHVSKDSQGSSDSRSSSQDTIVFMLRIRELTGIPPVFSEFVFCEFGLDNQETQLVLPRMEPQTSSLTQHSIRFDYEHELSLPMSEEVLDFCGEGAIPIHVYSQRTDLVQDQVETTLQQKKRSLEEVWDLVSKRLEVSMEILELNDEGEYAPVDVVKENKGTGGHFQIRQGQQKRIRCGVRCIPGSGSLPLDPESIMEVCVGGPVVRTTAQSPLDSYQEEDLNQLRETWSHALDTRKIHLQSQIQAFMNIKDKSDQEREREESLLDQLVQLMEEQNATYSPPDNSKIPGSYTPAPPQMPEGREQHQPVIFINSDCHERIGEFENEIGIPTFGMESVLSNEIEGSFIALPIVGMSEEEVSCLAAWDASLHDSPVLNKVTDSSQRIYLIAKVTVRLSQPCVMDIVLRKRFSCVVVPTRQSLTGRIWKKLGHSNPLTSVSVVYHIVYNIPTTSSELENRESLAIAAASGHDIVAQDGESFVEKYSKGICGVDEILRTDRVRQKIALKELLSSRRSGVKSTQGMRKTISVPNMRFIKSALSMENMSASYCRPSDSYQELCLESRKIRNPNCDDGRGGTLRPRMTSSKTMTTLHEEKSSLGETNFKKSINSRQSLSTIRRWGDKKGAIHSEDNLLEGKDRYSPEFGQLDKKGGLSPSLDKKISQENSSLVSSGYESKAVSISTLSDEEQELQSGPN